MTQTAIPQTRWRHLAFFVIGAVVIAVGWAWLGGGSGASPTAGQLDPARLLGTWVVGEGAERTAYRFEPTQYVLSHGGRETTIPCTYASRPPFHLTVVSTAPDGKGSFAFQVLGDPKHLLLENGAQSQRLERQP